MTIKVSPDMFDDLIGGTPSATTSNNPAVSSDMFDDLIERDNTKTEEEKEVKSGEWLETDNFSTAMAFMQGVTYGWYDEYRVGITALAESVWR